MRMYETIKHIVSHFVAIFAQTLIVQCLAKIVNIGIKIHSKFILEYSSCRLIERYIIICAILNIFALLGFSFLSYMKEIVIY